MEVFLEFLGSFFFELPMQLSRFEGLCAFREEYDPKRSIGSAS